MIQCRLDLGDGKTLKVVLFGSDRSGFQKTLPAMIFLNWTLRTPSWTMLSKHISMEHGQDLFFSGLENPDQAIKASTARMIFEQASNFAGLEGQGYTTKSFPLTATSYAMDMPPQSEVVHSAT